MSLRLSNHLMYSPTPWVVGIFGRLVLQAATLSILAAGGTLRSEAGPSERPPQPPATTQRPTPTPLPKLRINKRPHLVAIGPMGIDVQPLAGPRVRRPPLLPVPKVVEAEPEAAKSPSSEPAQPAPAQPSAFSPDAPPVLLPTEKPPVAPAPAPKVEPTESVLAPAARAEAELRDAIIYFETPAGPAGSQVTIPAAMPLTSPAPAVPPQSRATYRKEKE